MQKNSIGKDLSGMRPARLIFFSSSQIKNFKGNGTLEKGHLKRDICKKPG